jgi:formylglycine-generating enzyme required for sulfatase activity
VGEVAWYDSNSGMTHPVGGRKPNELGLHDMSGNVWEWCHDWYQDSYSGLSHTDPEGPGSGSDRVGRGGSWFNAAVFCRLAYRSRLAPAITFDRIGFRVALAAPLQPVTASVPVAAPPDVVAGDGGATPGAVAVPETGKDWTVPEIGMEFVWIRQLNLWVGKYEVTNGEYRRKEPRHDSKAFENHTLNGDRQPVVEVNWDDAVAYAAWLTERERAAGRLPAGMRYRLPTENEFLAYAQCGDGREYPWGSHWPPRNGQAGNYSGQESAWRDRVLGYNDGHPVTCNVEESWTNPWGLYGVGGNVWEICARDAVPGQSFGAWRGASWRDSIRSYAECFLRFDCVASNQCEGNGFRVVLSR